MHVWMLFYGDLFGSLSNLKRLQHANATEIDVASRFIPRAE